MKAKNESPERTRKVYAKPQLVKYGEVSSLTQTGTGTQDEKGSQTQVSKRPVASDRSVKENIVRIGTHPLGIGLYLFDYKPEFRESLGVGRQFGVMADEVETVVPHAVSTHGNGYKVVDYAMLGIRAGH